MILNENQTKAVHFKDGRVAVISCPGSGKTRVLIARIIYLIKELKTEPSEILVITFTNKAKNEIIKRLKEEMNYIPKVMIHTFHSFAFSQILEMYPSKERKNVRPITDVEVVNILKTLIKENNLDGLETTTAINVFRGIRNRFIKTRMDECFRLLYLKLFELYQSYLEEHYYYDFDQMVYSYMKILDNEDFLYGIASKIKYIMVDECQDMNQIQFDLCLKLESIHHNLMLVGDPDQSIYKWRGSDVGLINLFVKEYEATVIELNENYRSDGYIVEATNALISHNQNRICRFSEAMKPAVVPITFQMYPSMKTEAFNVIEEIINLSKNGTSYNDIFILSRRHKDGVEIEKYLRLNKIPYKKDAFSFFDYIEIKIIHSIYRLLINHNDDIAFEYIVDKPAKGIQLKKAKELANQKYISIFEACKMINNKNTQNFITLIEILTKEMANTEPIQFFQLLVKEMKVLEYRLCLTNDAKINVETFGEMFSQIKGEDLIQATTDFLNNVIFQAEETEKKDVVRLMTIHQAKGLEAEYVFIVGMNEPYFGSDKIDETEERRVNYVAATRAKTRLWCSCYGDDHYKRFSDFKPSKFYRELYNGKMVKHHAKE